MTVTIGRRELLAALGGGVAWPFAARAQQRGRVQRVGILMPYPKGDSENEARIRAFKQELARLGWTEGGNIQFDEHWTADNMDRVRAEAAALVASNPNIIVTTGGRVVPVFMRLIPVPIDQNPCAHWRSPMDMMRQGWSTSLFQALQQWSTRSS